jgi:aminoglycoside 6'-N-acetyltransferase I
MMPVKVREMGVSDRVVWAQLRSELWPEHLQTEHVQWVDESLRGQSYRGFVAETADGRIAGFAEIAIRPYANGCDTHPVPFLEGIFVRPEHRRQGVAAQLIAFIEGLLLAQGYRELGSDALLDNVTSHAAHRAWGFEETERVVYFRKPLKPASR